MPGLPTHLMQELNFGTVETNLTKYIRKNDNYRNSYTDSPKGGVGRDSFRTHLILPANSSLSIQFTQGLGSDEGKGKGIRFK